MSSRSLSFAVEQAYRGLVSPGLFPAGALHLQLPPESLDVNVHPTKREVRLRDERKAFAAVQEAVVRALAGAASYGGGGLLEVSPTDGAREGARMQGLLLAEDRGPYGAAALASTGTAVATDGSAPAPAGMLRGPFRLLGQVMDSYIVAEGPAGVVVVDQHAAHERIVFNRLVATAASRQRQPLLVPILLHLTPTQAACLEDCRADLAGAGLEIEDFGSNVARLVAYDPVLPERRLDRLALEVLDTLVGEGVEIDLHRRLERAMYTVACHSSVRFGQRLAREEMEELLRDLEVADPGITCPHGRPTLLEIPEVRLRREFKRGTT